jgi:hypothetical protein
MEKIFLEDYQLFGHEVVFYRWESLDDVSVTPFPSNVEIVQFLTLHCFRRGRI